VQGVVKALFQQDLLPRVISGSSVGSIGKLPIILPSDCSKILSAITSSVSPERVGRAARTWSVKCKVIHLTVLKSDMLRIQTNPSL
jgi:hypothetical protein